MNQAKWILIVILLVFLSGCNNKMMFNGHEAGLFKMNGCFTEDGKQFYAIGIVVDEGDTQ